MRKMEKLENSGVSRMGACYPWIATSIPSGRRMIQRDGGRYHAGVTPRNAIGHCTERHVPAHSIYIE